MPLVARGWRESIRASPSERDSLRREELSQRYRHERIASFTPGVQPALQRADASNALIPEQERHTGARGLVGSSAVKDDVAIAREPIILLLQLIGVHSECAWNRLRVGLEIDGMP
jgi:hypothetical protein